MVPRPPGTLFAPSVFCPGFVQRRAATDPARGVSSGLLPSRPMGCTRAPDDPDARRAPVLRAALRGRVSTEPRVLQRLIWRDTRIPSAGFDPIPAAHRVILGEAPPDPFRARPWVPTEESAVPCPTSLHLHRFPNLPQGFWGRCEPRRAEGALTGPASRHGPPFTDRDQVDHVLRRIPAAEPRSMPLPKNADPVPAPGAADLPRDAVILPNPSGPPPVVASADIREGGDRTKVSRGHGGEPL
jgi:hypothetical protein